MLNSGDLILFGPYFELKFANLLISALLEWPELKEHIFVVFGLVSQVTFEFPNARVLLVFALSQIFNLALVNVSQVLFGMRQLFLLPFFQFINFFGVRQIELRFYVVVRRQDTIHVLLSLFLCIQKAKFSPVELIFCAFELILKVWILASEEILVLIEQINLFSETFIPPFHLMLALLKSTVLHLQVMLDALNLVQFVFGFPQRILRDLSIVCSAIDPLALLFERVKITLQFEVSWLERSHTPLTIILDFFELAAERTDFNLLLFALVLGLAKLVEKFGAFALLIVQIVHVVVQGLKNANLNELFERKVFLGSVFHLHIAFFANNEISLDKFSFECVHLFIKLRDFSTSIFFADFSDLVGVLLFELLLLVAKVLLLCLNDHRQLCLLTFDLLDELLKVGYLLKILDFLRSNFLVQNVLLLLISHVRFDVTSCCEARGRSKAEVIFPAKAVLTSLGWAVSGETPRTILEESSNAGEAWSERKDVSVGAKHVRSIAVSFRDWISIFKLVHVIFGEDTFTDLYQQKRRKTQQKVLDYFVTSDWRSFGGFLN